MKTMIVVFLAALLFWMQPFCSSAQDMSELKNRLTDKNTLEEIMTTVDDYLKAMPEGDQRNRLQKHFSRWAYYQSRHLGPNGEFVNISAKTLEAVSGLSDAPLTAANGSWGFVGPGNAILNNPSADVLGNGRVDRIAFHPTDPNIIYVGTPAGGLWRTTNGGTSWVPVSSYIPSLGISGIVVSYADPNTIYVLTGDGDSFITNGLVLQSGFLQLSAGVLVSHDAGATWQQTGQLSANEFVGHRLVQHPGNPNILLAATSDGLYRTINGGTTWVLENPGLHYDIEFKPGTPSTVYACGPGSFIYSTNSGDTWNSNTTFNEPLCTIGFFNGFRVELAVTAALPNKVYLLAAPATYDQTHFCGFYTSSNSGLSFTKICDSPNILGKEYGNEGDQSDYDMGVTVKPTDGQKVIVGGLVIFKSGDGGNSFSWATTYREGLMGLHYIHPDVHDVAYNPLNNYLYAATDGGFYRSVDDGASWTNLMSGINTAQFYNIDDYDANQYTILGGCQDNGVKYRTANSSTFSQVYCCDGGDGVIDYTDESKGYNVVNTSIKQFDDFTSFGPSTVTTDPNYFFPNLELNTSNPDILYYSYTDVRQYNRATGVLSGFSPASYNGCSALKTCPSNSQRVYAAGGDYRFGSTGGLFTTPNGGSGWSILSVNPGFPAFPPRIADIGVRPNNSLQVYATFSGYANGVKVIYSADGGNNWVNISYDLPNVPVWSIEVDAANNVYIGCDIGVYYHASGTTYWEPFYNFLPNVPVTDLEINEGADQLLAATFGRGIWKSPLHAACPVDLVTGFAIGQYFRSASNSITCNGQVSGGAGTSAVLRAGNYVDLMPGFRADSDPGAKFLAYNGPCDSGVPPVFGPEQGPVFPSEISAIEKNMTRHDGTLEVLSEADGQKEVVVRLFTDGKARVLLAAPDGKFISDIAVFSNMKGNYTYPVNSADLNPGTYYLYLVVNDKVVHLQEIAL